jgi:hypothetical protein
MIPKHGKLQVRKIRRDGVTQRYWVRPDPHYDRAIMSWARQMFTIQSWKQQQNLQQAGITDEQIDRLLQSPTFTNAIMRFIDREIHKEGNKLRNMVYDFFMSLRPLIKRGISGAGQFLVKLATECTNKDVRKDAMHAICMSGAEEAPRLLRQVIDNSPDEWGRRNAMHYISNIITDLMESAPINYIQLQEGFREALDILADAMLERWFPYETMFDYAWLSRSLKALTTDEQYFDEHTRGSIPDALKRKLLDGMAHLMSLPNLDIDIFDRCWSILRIWMSGYALQKLREVEARMQDPHYLAHAHAESRLSSIRRAIRFVQERIARGNGA